MSAHHVFACSPIKVAMLQEEWELGSKDVSTVWSLSAVIVGILRGLDQGVSVEDPPIFNWRMSSCDMRYESPCVEHTSGEPVIAASLKAG